MQSCDEANSLILSLGVPNNWAMVYSMELETRIRGYNKQAQTTDETEQSAYLAYVL